MKLSKVLRPLAIINAVFIVFVFTAAGLFIKEESKYWPFFVEHGYDDYDGLFCLLLIAGGFILAVSVYAIMQGLAELLDKNAIAKSSQPAGAECAAQDSETVEAVQPEETTEETAEETAKENCWICPICGSENPDTLEVCPVCVKDVGAEQPDESEEATEENTWICPICGSKNPDTLERCPVCVKAVGTRE